MIPQWLNIVAMASLALGIACAAWMTLVVVRDPPKMAIMRFVWPLAALFAGLLVVWFHHRWASAGKDAPKAVIVSKGALHCGAACTMADILAEGLTVLAPAVLVAFGHGWLFPERIFAAWVFDYLCAFALGVLFQYFAIAPMRGISGWKGIWVAAKADAASLTAWQVGMYGGMAIAHFLIFEKIFGVKLSPTMPVFWFSMQFAMLAGFLTSYPVNWWLISAGIKEKM